MAAFAAFLLAAAATAPQAEQAPAARPHVQAVATASAVILPSARINEPESPRRIARQTSRREDMVLIEFN